MDTVTKNLSRYVKEKGINIAKMSRDTGIPYVSLYDSLINEKRDRSIRGQELMDVCEFLGADPRDFADKSERG